MKQRILRVSLHACACDKETGCRRTSFTGTAFFLLALTSAFWAPLAALAAGFATAFDAFAIV